MNVNRRLCVGDIQPALTGSSLLGTLGWARHLHTCILAYLHICMHVHMQCILAHLRLHTLIFKLHTFTLALSYFHITFQHTCIFLHHYSCTSMQHDAYFHKFIFAICKTYKTCKTFDICSNSTPFLSTLPPAH